MEDATALAQRIKKKECSPAEAVRDSLQRMQEKNESLNAVVRTYGESALQQAEKITLDAPFAGVPLLLKEMSQTLKGQPASAGSRLFKDRIAGADSHFVSRLKKAGFIPVGHTNAPEFGLKNITEPELFGPSRNPWNQQHSPGGSSGGAAAAVASGMTTIAGASDGGGSIRIPASFTGLIGLKPTRGRTPVGPGAGRQWQGAAIDFMLTKSVRDTAALLDLLQVVQPEAAYQTPLFPDSYARTITGTAPQFTIGFITESPVGTPVSEEAVKAVHNTASMLESLGHRVTEIASWPVHGTALMQEYYRMNAGEMAAMVKQIEAGRDKPLTADEMEIEGWVLAETGRSLSAADYSLSLSAWDAAAARMAEFHQSVDLLITPSTAFAAPKVGELTPTRRRRDELLSVSGLPVNQQLELIYEMFEPSLTYTPYTQLANLTGQPAISLPLHMTSNGLPLGVQVMAPKGKEHWLLQLAAQLEQTSCWHTPGM